MTCVIGIDPSLSCTSVFVLQDDGTVVGRHNFVTSVEPGVAMRVLLYSQTAEMVRQFIRDYSIACVCIEGYALGFSRPGAAQLIEFGYELRRMLCCLDATPKVIEVPPATLKKHAAGKGNADKIAVATRMAQRFPGLEFNTNDETDAAALALMALQAAELAEPENQIQRECIDTILGRNKKPKKSKKKSAA